MTSRLDFSASPGSKVSSSNRLSGTLFKFACSCISSLIHFPSNSQINLSENYHFSSFLYTFSGQDFTCVRLEAHSISTWEALSFQLLGIILFAAINHSYSDVKFLLSEFPSFLNCHLQSILRGSLTIWKQQLLAISKGKNLNIRAEIWFGRAILLS